MEKLEEKMKDMEMLKSGRLVDLNKLENMLMNCEVVILKYDGDRKKTWAPASPKSRMDHTCKPQTGRSSP